MKPSAKPRSVACSTCGKAVEWGPQSPYRPFCSERCRNIDLGAWAAEEYRVAEPPGGHKRVRESDE